MNFFNNFLFILNILYILILYYFFGQLFYLIGFYYSKKYLLTFLKTNIDSPNFITNIYFSMLRFTITKSRLTQLESFQNFLILWYFYCIKKNVLLEDNCRLFQLLRNYSLFKNSNLPTPYMLNIINEINNKENLNLIITF